MNTEKLVITLITIVTLGIFGTIMVTSLSKEKTQNATLDRDQIIGTDPHVKGAAIGDNNVILVEFSDFECPACVSFAPVVEDIVNKYNISSVYRHFPLPQHTKAKLSAQASEAANLQGKFWEYESRLFEKSPELSEEQLVTYAQDLGLDVEKFKSDLTSQTAIDRVKQDMDFGNAIGINATPTFYRIKGDKVEKFNSSGSQSLEDWVKSAVEGSN